MVFAAVNDEEPERLPSIEEARAEIEDWKRRVDDLFADIRSWSSACGYRVTTPRTTVANEGVMRHHGLPSFRLPILDVQGSDGSTVRFIPDARWVRNTRGRIMILGANRPARLLDTATEPGEVCWRLFDSTSWMRNGDPFTREGFLSLFGGRR